MVTSIFAYSTASSSRAAYLADDSLTFRSDVLRCKFEGIDHSKAVRTNRTPPARNPASTTPRQANTFPANHHGISRRSRRRASRGQRRRRGHRRVDGPSAPRGPTRVLARCFSTTSTQVRKTFGPVAASTTATLLLTLRQELARSVTFFAVEPTVAVGVELLDQLLVARPAGAAAALRVQGKGEECNRRRGSEHGCIRSSHRDRERKASRGHTTTKVRPANVLRRSQLTGVPRRYAS